MAKGKYEQWLTPEGLLKIGAWAGEGMSDEEIAHKMGISRSTLNDWKKKYPDISDTLKKNKEIVDIQVENSLFQRAVGMTKTVKKPIKVKEIRYKDGKRLSEKERVVYAEEEIYIPPDTAALIFWLKNRLSKKWRDKVKSDTDKKEQMARIEQIVARTEKMTGDNMETEDLSGIEAEIYGEEEKKDD